MLNKETMITRERLRMNFDWRFTLGHAYDTNTDLDHATGYFSYLAKAGYGDGPAAREYDDRPWRKINLPHDWAVEQPFDKKGSHSHGYKAVGRNFPEASVGWYRKTFFIPEADLRKRICIEFDGIFRNSIVWMNGFYLGIQPSGYSSFYYDVTDYINYGGDNVVAVRVDVTIEEGWFYEGAGIYRHVWLTKTAPLHIDYHGIFVSCEVKQDSATVNARVTVVNEESGHIQFKIEHMVIDADGKKTASIELKTLSLESGESKEYCCQIHIQQPELWSIENPYLYQLVTVIYKNNTAVDHHITPFGIRSICFDPDTGFFLNDAPLKLKGTNNHQDHAGVGIACPDALWEFRINRLKEMGCNAYRCSHHPPSPALLDACDRLGVLVIDENRLMGTTAEILDHLKRMILRDRNHPSIIAWSLGNEEWKIEGDIKGTRIVSAMQRFARRLDPTRYITVASSGCWGRGVSVPVEVMGYNYICHGNTDEHHRNFPHQPGMGTEESTTHQTRGVYEDNLPIAHMAPSDLDPEKVSIEKGWKYYAERQYLAGLFYWTGFDYKGESNPFGFPAVSSQFGIIDTCGFPKDSFYYLKSWWTDRDVLQITPHWNWEGKEGKIIRVRVYSNCEEIELFLNGKTLDRKKMEKNSHIEWEVSYQPGKLRASGYKKGEKTIEHCIETSGKPASIHLSAWKKEIMADLMDINVITVMVKDSYQSPVPDANNEITFSLEGPGKIIGMGNGDPSCHEPDRIIETVELMRITDLQILAHDGEKSDPAKAFNFTDKEWELFTQEKTEQTYKKGTEIVIRGVFILPRILQKSEITIFPKSLCEEQSLYINGHLISEGTGRSEFLKEHVLDHSLLKEGENIIAIAGPMLEKRNESEELNTDPGIIRLFMPAGQWKRTLFNGLAQVIIQASDKPGDIMLTASSPGLQKGKINVSSNVRLSGHEGVNIYRNTNI